MHRATSILRLAIVAILMIPSIGNSQDTDSGSKVFDAATNKAYFLERGGEKPPKEQALSKQEVDNFVVIEKKLEKLIEKENSFEWITPLTNLCAVIVGALIGGLLSYKIQLRQTKFEINKSLMDWKIKQLSELYGPLYAVLHQSNAIYRQMNIVLSKTDGNIFRLSEDSEKSDFDKKIFQIYVNDEWVIFRTITHINEVYGKGYGIESYFDELVDIGSRMVNIVENKAGYVREDQSELADVFGKYLAHYTVLCQLHKQMKKSLETQEKTSILQKPSMPVDHTAAFPREIQGLVQKGYQKLNKELNSWGEKGEMNV